MWCKKNGIPGILQQLRPHIGIRTGIRVYQYTTPTSYSLVLRPKQLHESEVEVRNSFIFSYSLLFHAPRPV